MHQESLTMPANEPKPTGEIVLYQAEDGRTHIECRFANENIWLTQRLLAELYQIGVNTINHHIKEILADGELAAAATIRQYRIVQPEGTRTIERQVEHYSLEMILAVGYRVRSLRGTAFRQWATAQLKEYLVKGFVMDDERLKNPPGPGVPDYFDELLERIRDIRASEKRMYLRVRDIFALAADYQTEAAVQRSLAEVTADRTTIIVAHRLSMIRQADLIYVLDDGLVKEQGRHDELVAADGLYASMWRVQTGEISRRRPSAG